MDTWHGANVPALLSWCVPVPNFFLWCSGDARHIEARTTTTIVTWFLIGTNRGCIQSLACHQHFFLWEQQKAINFYSRQLLRESALWRKEDTHVHNLFSTYTANKNAYRHLINLLEAHCSITQQQQQQQQRFVSEITNIAQNGIHCIEGLVIS